MPRGNKNIEFEKLFEIPREKAIYVLLEIFADKTQSDEFTDFLNLKIKRGKAKEVAGFIKGNRFEDVFPQLLRVLALAEEKSGELHKALSLYERLLDVVPNSRDLLYDIARLNFALNNYESARKYCEKTLETDEAFAEAYFLLGNVYRRQNDFPRALENYLKAIELEYGEKDAAFYNAGVVCEKMFDFDKALDYYDKALSVNNNLTDAHWNKALILLRKKRYDAAWGEFEWRKRKHGFSNNKFPIKDCEKNSLSRSDKILLYTEQGYGDAIQFLRFVRLLDAAWKSISVKPALQKLFEASGLFDEVFADNEKIAFENYDCKASLLSLPYLLDVRNVELKEPLWRFDKNKLEKKTLGIVWRGNPEHENDFYRSMNVSEFEKILDNFDGEIYSLQYGEKNAREIDFMRKNGVLDKLSANSDFLETAQAISSLDLIITVDTSVAHLAASMLKPVFVLLPKNSDWRWGENEGECDWYPSVKTFRQTELGNWDDVIVKVKRQLHIFFDNKIKVNRRLSEEEIISQALLYEQAGDTEKALEILLSGVEQGASSNEMLYNIALAYHKLGKCQEARKFYETLIKTINAEEVFYNYFLLLTRCKKTLPENEIVNKALRLFGNSFKINFAVAGYYKQSENFAKAIELYLKAIELNPEYTDAFFNLASVYYIIGEIDSAQKIYSELMRQNPANANLLYNFALTFQEQNKFDEAEKLLRKAATLKKRPEFETALAEILLSRGKYDEGLKFYEKRFVINKPALKINVPVSWDAMQNKKILIFEEQGIGDTIQFIRYAKPLSSNNEIYVAARNSLLPFLAEQKFISAALDFEHAKKTDFDFSIPVVSLFKLHWEKTKAVAEFPPYLEAKKITLRENGKPKIAFAWRGNPYPAHQRKRHLNVNLFSEIIDNINADFFPLVQFPTDEELHFFETRENIIYDKKYFSNFLTLASLIFSVEAVITVDTVYAHLSGALGKPTYILLHYSPDWRWGASGGKTVWYPEARLLRQKKYGDWSNCFSELKIRLEKEVENHDKL